MHKEGWATIIVALAVVVISVVVLYVAEAPHWLSASILVPELFISGIIINFFRYPNRTFKGDELHDVIAPSDGTIVTIEEVHEPDQRACPVVPAQRTGTEGASRRRTLQEGLSAEVEQRERTFDHSHQERCRTSHHDASGGRCNGTSHRHLHQRRRQVGDQQRAWLHQVRVTH